MSPTGISTACIGQPLLVSLNPLYVGLGFLNSYAGTFVALTTTTYAFYDVLKHPSFRPWFRTYIVLAGVSIGGAALWAMHFVALAGLRLTTCDGAARVEVTEHNLGLTLVAVVAIATAGAVSMYLVLPTASDALGENAATRTASAASAASTAEAPASADPAALEAGAAKVPTPKQAAITKAKQYTDPPVKTVRHGSIMVIMNGVEHQRRKARDAKAGRTAAQDDAALRRRETVGLDGRPARRMSTLEGMDYWRLRMPPWTACLFSRGDSISIAKFSMRGLVLGTLLMVAASCGVHYMEMIGMHGAFVLEYSVGLVVAAAVVTAVASVVLLFSVVQVAYMSDSSMAFVSRAVASLFISVTFNAAHYAGLYSVKFMYTGDVDRNISHELGLAVEVDAVVVCLVAFSFNVSQLLWIFSFLQGLAAPLRST